MHDTEATISRSTHKYKGEQGSTVQASTASSGQTASELLTCAQQSMEVSLSSLGVEQIPD